MGRLDLPLALLELLAQQAKKAKQKPKAEQAVQSDKLFIPDEETAKQMQPVIAGALIMLGLYFARQMMESDQDPSNWAAFRTDKVSDGEWWRVISYSFLYDDPINLTTDITTIIGTGTALTRLQSPELAFATFRLGIFAALLGIWLDKPARDQPIHSLSGPAYSMLGATLVTSIFQRKKINFDELGVSGPLGLAILICNANRSLSTNSRARLAQLIAFGAGGGAASIAQIVGLVTANQKQK